MGCIVNNWISINRYKKYKVFKLINIIVEIKIIIYTINIGKILEINLKENLHLKNWNLLKKNLNKIKILFNIFCLKKAIIKD